MTRDQAICYIRRFGVVLESARGDEPSLAERIAGAPIQGSWWSHPKGHEIFEISQKVRDSKAVLVCGLANGRVTYVHRRLWPHFIRMAQRFPSTALDQIIEVHLPSGRHKRQDVRFPEWVPEQVLVISRTLSESQAIVGIEPWLNRYSAASRGSPGSGLTSRLRAKL